MAIPPIGVFLPSFGAKDTASYDPVGAARHAEALGFESVWVADQLVDGVGNAVLDSILVLTAAAAVTERVKLGFGVLAVPLRPPAWIAKSVTTLQYLSGDRVILGVGIGGDRHAQSWTAAGVPKEERGRRLDAALRDLPDLIAGKEVDGIRMSPATAVPPILVGGMSEAALRRANAHDGWIPMPLPPEGVREAAAQVRVPITASLISVAMAGDPTLPSRDGLVSLLVDPEGTYGMPQEVAEQFLIHSDVEEMSALLNAYGDAGAARIAVMFLAGDWFRQAELLASAAGLH